MVQRRRLIRQFDRRDPGRVVSVPITEEPGEPTYLQGAATTRRYNLADYLGYTRTQEGALTRLDAPAVKFVKTYIKETGRSLTASYIPKTIYFDSQGRVVREITRSDYKSYKGKREVERSIYVQQLNEYYSDGSVKRVQRYKIAAKGSDRKQAYRSQDISFAGGVSRAEYEHKSTRYTPKPTTTPTVPTIRPTGTDIAVTRGTEGGGTVTVTRNGLVTLRNSAGKITDRYYGNVAQTSSFLQTQSKIVRDAAEKAAKVINIKTAQQMLIEIFTKQGKSPTIDAKGNVQFIEKGYRTVVSPEGSILTIPVSATFSQSVFDLPERLKTKKAKEEYKKLLKEQALQREIEKGNFVKYGNVTTVAPKTDKEKKFHESLKKVIERDERLKGNFMAAFTLLRINPKESDKWYIKAVKGAGQLAVATTLIGNILANAVDKAIISGKGLLSTSNIRKATREELAAAAKKTPAEILKQVDPRKPENWAGIALIVGSVVLAPGAFLRVGSRLKKNYIPSVRNLGKMKSGFIDARVKLNVAIKLARKAIRTKTKVSFNKSLLRRAIKARIELNKGIVKLTALEKNPKILKLTDMNPFIKSADLIKQLKKEQTFFHATSVRVSDLFGQKFTKIKSEKAILEAVRKATKPRRIIVPKTDTARLILNFSRRNRGVIGGSNAQNLFVKKGLTRLAKDFDILMPSPKANAIKLVKLLREDFPYATVKLIKTKKAYKIIFNGKGLVDIVNRPKGLKIIKIGKDTIIDVSELVKGKIKTLKDYRFKYREIKDIKDLQRLVGSFFSAKKFLQRVKDPRNYFRVKPQPKGMGADRFKFGETQLFFDLKVPTGYAYNSLVKNIIPKSILKWAKKIGFKESFIRRLDSLKTISANDRIIVLQLRTKTSILPKSLRLRVKKASKGMLTERQQNVLRHDLRKWINENPGKASIGSKTASRPFGEREIVLPVGSVLKAVKRKISIDPETKLFIDIIETTNRLKKVPIMTWRNLIKDMKRFIIESPENVKLKFSSGDIANMRKYKKVLRRAEDLATRDTLFFENIVQKMLKSKKAVKRRALPKPKKRIKVRRKREAVIKVRKGKVIPKVIRGAARKAEVKRPVKRKIVRPVKRPVKRVTERIPVRPVKRPVKRIPERPVKRPTKRIPERPVKRVIPKPRIKPPVRVTPRVSIPRRPRIKVKPIPKPKPKPPRHTFEELARGRGVDVLVKKRGAKARYARINSRPLKYVDAKNLGRYITDNLPLASYRLVISKSKAKLMKFKTKTPAMKFRPRKGKTRLPSETKVEKRKYRIDRTLEKKGITIKGLKAARTQKGILELIRKARYKKGRKQIKRGKK